ncbi:hypothetical protein B0H14DRAFT_3529274 [Mycena olivaceomarginata]|nr:hypothetical protein B0H14DRAFT_3529274 [Mycena olivaceomarginata]
MGFLALPFDNVNHGVPMNGRELRRLDTSDVRLCVTLVSGVVEQRRKRSNRGKLVDFRGGDGPPEDQAGGGVSGATSVAEKVQAKRASAAW